MEKLQGQLQPQRKHQALPHGPVAGYGMGGFSDKGELHQEVLRCHGADREERRKFTDSQKTREAVHAQINAHLDRSDVLLQHIFVIERERERESMTMMTTTKRERDKREKDIERESRTMTMTMTTMTTTTKRERKT
jgi:hypothetical protein